MKAVRRVVTDHDKSGRAVVAIDEVLRKATASRPGHERLDLWKGDDGVAFRLVRYEPGVAPRNHRTETVDYAIVLSGEIYALMDEGETLMKAGDCLVQRGTNHAWANRSDAPCLVAFILVNAKPV